MVAALANNPPSEAGLNAARHTESRHYPRTKRYLSFLGYLLGGFLLVALLASGLSRYLICFLALPVVAGAFCILPRIYGGLGFDYSATGLPYRAGATQPLRTLACRMLLLCRFSSLCLGSWGWS